MLPRLARGLLLGRSAVLPTVSRRAMAAAAVGLDVGAAQAALRAADAVCFDVDSTVITDEGIDVLAAHCGAGDAVKEWTARAMGGGVKFEDALAARLDLIKPSVADIEACLAAHPPALNPGVHALMDALRENGAQVFLVSGGFRLMIEPVAARLGVPKTNIFANTILFDDAGNYTGFDATEPTSADGGKPAVVARLQADLGLETVVMIGDGATDMQAKPPAAAFIGYGGVADREVVREGADWFVMDFDELISVVRGSSP